MNALHEVALIAALASPMLVIAAVNAALYLAGERGTLLFPDRSAFPALALESLPIVQGYLATEPEPEFEEELRLAA